MEDSLVPSSLGPTLVQPKNYWFNLLLLSNCHLWPLLGFLPTPLSLLFSELSHSFCHLAFFSLPLFRRQKLQICHHPTIKVHLLEPTFLKTNTFFFFFQTQSQTPATTVASSHPPSINSPFTVHTTQPSSMYYFSHYRPRFLLKNPWLPLVYGHTFNAWKRAGSIDALFRARQKGGRWCGWELGGEGTFFLQINAFLPHSRTQSSSIHKP